MLLDLPNAEGELRAALGWDDEPMPLDPMLPMADSDGRTGSLRLPPASTGSPAHTNSAQAVAGLQQQYPHQQSSSIVRDDSRTDMTWNSERWGSMSNHGTGTSQAGSRSKGSKRGPRPRLFKKVGSLVLYTQGAAWHARLLLAWQ
jgi:hypothetical protein